jgi:hypothetical protein
MRLATLLVLEPNLTVVFSHSPSTSLALEALEASLSAQLRQSRALPPCDSAIALVCLDHPVAVQRKGDLLYAVAAASTEDELGGACAAAPPEHPPSPTPYSAACLTLPLARPPLPLCPSPPPRRWQL